MPILVTTDFCGFKSYEYKHIIETAEDILSVDHVKELLEEYGKETKLPFWRLSEWAIENYPIHPAAFIMAEFKNKNYYAEFILGTIYQETIGLPKFDKNRVLERR